MTNDLMTKTAGLPGFWLSIKKKKWKEIAAERKKVGDSFVDRNGNVVSLQRLRERRGL